MQIITNNDLRSAMHKFEIRCNLHCRSSILYRFSEVPGYRLSLAL